ncbi:hypothetical protein [Telmatospirillum sp.]|uniref:hypothetical protein n=1 Tax=Telmatospirillum sp. TaxID=2079197 RepID=UPI00284E90FD|nr:hypothetical protein [Telmatospirillum sp.]MDR3440848.1 hypothetical protein [Telmatospirillum sp.]
MNGLSISEQWHVQYRKDGKDGIEMHPTPERAIDAACRMLDDGYDVYGIGTLADSVGRTEIARIYAMRERQNPLFRRKA